jgi:predicted nucleic acid-binding protein
VIAYLDTSSLVKLFVREAGTDQVEELVRAASIVATSVIAYTEARGAFARRAREGALTAREHARIKEDFEGRWQALLALEVSVAIAREGCDLAEAHTLRALDALHLASYRQVAAAMAGEPVRFSSFDDRLSAAAAAEESSS